MVRLADLHYSFMGATQIRELETKARELTGQFDCAPR